MLRKVTDALKDKNGFIYSIELIPPLVQKGTESLYGTVEKFMGIKPPVFVSLTYHQQHLDIGKTEDGTGYQANLSLERPGTIMLSHRLAEEYPIIVIPHIICGGFSVHETQAALVELGYAGNINTVLALRGDPPYPYRDFKPAREGHSHASQLVKQIANLRERKYVGKESGVPVDFEIGVAAYPERHKEAPNFEWDLKWLKEKQELGADFAITQMFFDNEQYKRFLDQCEKQGITIPIIPGITPIIRKDQLIVLPHRFGCTIPDGLVERIQNAKDEDVKKIGIEFTVKQSQGLMESGAPIIHFFTYGAPKTVQEIVKQLSQ